MMFEKKYKYFLKVGVLFVKDKSKISQPSVNLFIIEYVDTCFISMEIGKILE